MKLLGNRLLVKSRGIKSQEDADIVIPEHHLLDSDICTTSSNETILRKSQAGVPTNNDREYILEHTDIIAKFDQDKWKPFFNYYLVRKCKDPQDDGGIQHISNNRNNFAEILAVGPDCGTKNVIGDLAYVDIDSVNPQKVEDTEHDWLVLETQIPFIVGD
jgi:hypothetical protein|tara:strand:+ start:330 stop:809 length:480 start_codon:yes stop_codon:yes gene_type:complete